MPGWRGTRSGRTTCSISAQKEEMVGLGVDGVAGIGGVELDKSGLSPPLPICPSRVSVAVMLTFPPG